MKQAVVGFLLGFFFAASVSYASLLGSGGFSYKAGLLEAIELLKQIELNTRTMAHRR